MQNKYVLDTSFISALYNDLDTHHAEAQALFLRTDSEDLKKTPITVLIELTLLSSTKGFKTYELQAFIAALVNEVDYWDMNTYVEFDRYVQKTKLNLKPIDYTVLFTAQKENAILFTFDKRLAREYAKISGV